jgi:hypothetical protein
MATATPARLHGEASTSIWRARVGVAIGAVNQSQEESRGLAQPARFCTRRMIVSRAVCADCGVKYRTGSLPRCSLTTSVLLQGFQLTAKSFLITPSLLVLTTVVCFFTEDTTSKISVSSWVHSNVYILDILLHKKYYPLENSYCILLIINVY